MADARIEPLAERHFQSLRRALDVVAREKKYLAFAQAPAPQAAYDFYRYIVDNGHCHFVAVAGEEVVGWCDVLPTHGETRAHAAVLGIGVVPAWRGRGIGPVLMRTAIESAWSRGFTRIELTVRVDNPRAIALYERAGFVREGLHRGAFRVDGEYVDSHAMALRREDG
ncbi:MAG TPA: GNAT family N-acetyltransferase [Xanthomonadales bacterium]|nr:GNAT family N-acetyltransferase [Xanthomonadales bacterium]